MGDPVTQNATLPTQQPLPDNVAQAAASAGLGALVKVYTPKRRNWALLIFNIIVGLVCAIFLLGLWLLWMVYRTPNLSRSLAARRLYLFEQGFIVLDKPDNPQAFRFDAIDTVFQQIVSRRTYGIEVARTYVYTVTARDGRVTKVTQFWSDIAELGSHINTSVSNALLPGTITAIERGQSVQFGDMTLNATGIAGRRKSVTWKEVSDVRIANGYVSVKVAGKFWSLSTVAAAKLPNLPLFLALAGRLKAAGGN
jgi:hypothetical protein